MKVSSLLVFISIHLVCHAAWHTKFINEFFAGGMYLENATSFLPNVDRFYQEGAVTTRARDQMPSVSAPNWSSIITGMGPDESGVSDNSWVPSDDNPPDSVVLELPPISGKGKVNDLHLCMGVESTHGLIN